MNILGVKAMLALLPDLPQIAVFDTAFHQTLPQHAYLYAVPYEYYQNHGVRRYGFMVRVFDMLANKPQFY